MIVATTQQDLLVDVTAPSGERIVAMKGLHDLIYVVTTWPFSGTVNVISHGSIKAFVEHSPVNESWFLQGVTNMTELVEEIQRQYKK